MFGLNRPLENPAAHLGRRRFGSCMICCILFSVRQGYEAHALASELVQQLGEHHAVKRTEMKKQYMLDVPTV